MSSSAAAPPDASAELDDARVSAPVPSARREIPARSRLSVGLAMRLGVGLVLLGATIVALGGDPEINGGFFRLALVVFASSLGFAVWLALRPADVERIALTWIALDLVLVSALVYMTDGALSGFAFLYGVVVLGGSVVVGPRPTLVIAGLAPVLYVSVALGLASGALPGPAHSVLTAPPPSEADFDLALLRNIVGLLLVGGLAALLSDRLYQTRGALVRATASAATNARLTEDIVRSLGSGLVTTNLDDIVQTINDAGAHMLGASSDRIVGQPLGRFFFDVTPMAEARSERVARRADDTTFPVGYSRTQLVSNAGEVRGWLVLYQDLTELATLREKAERAERLAVLGQLAAGLAHEIRNPLGAISGSVELVRDADILGAEDKRLLGTVLGEVDRVNELVSTMLELGRPTTPERRIVDVADIARTVVELARRQASTVSLVLESSPAMASVDPGQMRQVLWNLVKNAIQFSPKDGEVHVRARAEDGRVKLEVEDRGHGIDAADVARVFDPFFTKRAHGVGLGLAIAKQIVDAHGGTLTVESAPGRTCFVVSIASAPAE